MSHKNHTLPPDGQEVLLRISDPAGAISRFPVLAWRMGTEWWSGIPGNYLHIKTSGPGAWKLDDWTPLTEERDELVAAIENAQVALKICLMPRLTLNVAGNEAIIETTIAGLSAALAKIETKRGIA